jgi:SAM-dependent methyltransferase
MINGQQPAYSPAIFNVTSLQQAKDIILTPQAGMNSNERWQTETPYLLSLIERDAVFDADSVVLDYGCGIGRMAKALIEKYQCRVIGVDISPSMRALAASYVDSDRFFACAPDMLDWLPIKFDTVLAIWVLQHCHAVEQDIALLRAKLQWDGVLFVLNDQRRIVPTQYHGWVNDGLDVRALLTQTFSEPAMIELDPKIMGQNVCDSSYWAMFKA